ncbi:unnamed protein product [Symbiodinium natans]|uniref:Uncharacterized protein n=1 Tax=Symbiodinium natans TaxID=878477 RepID=A0A812RAS7_9DINO|nr:unnamed protein product [Symbiodinium natans]
MEGPLALAARQGPGSGPLRSPGGEPEGALLEDAQHSAAMGRLPRSRTFGAPRVLQPFPKPPIPSWQSWRRGRDASTRPPPPEAGGDPCNSKRSAACVRLRLARRAAALVICKRPPRSREPRGMERPWPWNRGEWKALGLGSSTRRGLLNVFPETREWNALGAHQEVVRLLLKAETRSARSTKCSAGL